MSLGKTVVTWTGEAAVWAKRGAALSVLMRAAGLVVDSLTEPWRQGMLTAWLVASAGAQSCFSWVLAQWDGSHTVGTQQFLFGFRWLHFSNVRPDPVPGGRKGTDRTILA